MIDLELRHITFIKSIISVYLTEYKLFLFGSRAKGTAKKFSDVDLALQSSDLTLEILNKIQFELENSTLPYQVDIVDLDNITEDFKKLIQNSMVEI